MSFNRRGESGNVFFTLFGAVALVGVIGVATTTLMKGPVGTVVTLNQKAKIESQLQIARKLVALDAAQRTSPEPDCDGDGTIEPMNPDITGNCATLITGGGCLPQITGAAKIDPWGTQVGYCGWDHATQGGSADQYDGTHIGCTPPVNTRALLPGQVGVSNQPVLAVISAGANRTFETVCNNGGPATTDYANKPSGSDDIVYEWTYEEAATGVGGGLWSLMSGSDAITTDNDVEFTNDATFSSGTSATFADQSSAAFNTGSVLDLTGGGLFRLPDQTTSGACGAANESMLRIDTTSGQTLQICDPAAAPDWTDIGGSGASSSVAGGDGDIQFNSNGALWADSAFQWDVDNDRLLIGSPAAPNDTVEIEGTVGISSDLNVHGIIEVDAGAANAPGFTFTSANNTGIFLDAGGDVGVSVGGTQIVDVTGSGLDVAGDLNTTDDVNVGNVLYVSSDAFINNDLDVGGIVFNSTGDLTVGDVLSVTSSAKFATNGHFGGAVNATRFLVDGTLNAGNIVDGDDGLESDGAGGIGLLTAGTRRMHIDSAGDIGIGVTGAPTATLDINGMLRLRNNSSIEAGDACTAQDGSIVYGSGDRLLLCSSMTGFWETIGATGGGGGGTVGLWERAYGAIQPIEGHGVDDFAFGNQQPETTGTFMFFDKSKGAFRVGTITDNGWTDARRGGDSFAAGADVIAEGDNSIALGHDVFIDGAHSFGFGLGSASGTSPMVGAQNSFGIFMGDQAGINLDTDHVMLLAGGRLVIDPDTTSATEIDPSNGLTVDVEGSVGAMNFCNEDGTECFTAGDITSGATGAPGGNRELLYNSNGDMAAAAGLIYSSSGGLGLNVADTATRLDVGGTIKMAYDGESCDATREGGIQYNSSTDTFYVCRTAGQPWQALAAGAAAAAGSDRQVQFNSNGLLDANSGLVYTSAGRLGVNTPSPQGTMHITVQSGGLGTNMASPATTGSSIRITGAGVETYIDDNTYLTTGSNFNIGTSSVHDFIMYTSGTERARIQDDGTFGIGRAVPATQLDVDGTMRMAYDGEACDATREGGIQYNSSTDTFYVCRTAGAGWQALAAGSATAAGGDRQIQFNSGGLLDANAGLVFSSTGDILVSGTYTGTASVPVTGAGTRMFFDVQTGAIRAGTTAGTHFDNAQIGANSAAFGENVRASGANSFATGLGSLASGTSSVAMGNAATASGNYGYAIGNNVSAGQHGIAMGRTVNVTGQYSAGWGVGNAAGVAPIVSGNSILGVFMGDQSGVTVSSNNTMAILGGGVVIDPRSPATNLTADTPFEVEGTAKIAYSGEACDATREGGIHYNSSTDTFYVCRTAGAGWQALAAGAASAGGSDRTLQFNSGGYLAGDANFVFTSAGRIGFGTASPATALHLRNSAPNLFLDLTAAGNTNIGFGGAGVAYSGIAWDSPTNDLLISVDTTSTGTGDFGIGVGSTIKFAMDNAGKVGIGDNYVPTTQLAVDGTIRMAYDGEACDATREGGIHYNSSDDTFYVCRTAGQPWQALAAGTAAAAGLNREIQFNSGGTFGTNPNLVFGSNGTLGIGTNNPQFQLHISSSADQAALRIEGNGTWNDAIWSVASLDTGDVWQWDLRGSSAGDYGNYNLNRFDGGTTSWSNILGIREDGRVGISKTDPMTQLDVDGTLRIAYDGEACDASREGSIHYSSSADEFYACKTAGGGWQALQLGTTVTAATPNRGIQFNSGGAFTADSLLTFTTTGQMNLGGGLILSGDQSPAQITANTNNYAPANFDTTSILRLSTDASRDLTGIAGGSDGRVLTIMNVGSNPLVLKNDVTSTAANRFLLGADLTLAANQSLMLVYDSSSSRWRPMSSVSAGGVGSSIRFTSLSDAPTSYAGQALRVVRVNAAATGVEFTNNVIESVGGIPAPAGFNLDDLSNVNAGAPTDGHCLKYTSASGLWETGSCVSGSTSPWTINGNDIYYNSSATPRVGIGNAAPTQALDVTGTVRASVGVQLGLTAGAAAPTYLTLDGISDVNAASPTVGHVLTYSGGSWVAAAPTGGGGGGFWTAGTGDDIYYNSGTPQVGIGNTNPTEALDVTGNVKLSGGLQLGLMTGVAAPGMLSLDDLSNVTAPSPSAGQVLLYSGGAWIPGTASASASASGSSRQLQFNSGGAFAADTNLVYTATGRLGVGNAAPTEALHVTGNLRVTQALKLDGVAGAAAPTGLSLDDLSNVTAPSPSAGQVLLYSGGAWIPGTASGGSTPAGSGREVQFRSGGALGADANFNYTATGRLGLGIASPLDMLHIGDGNIRIDGTAGSQAGCMRYNDSTDRLEYSNDCTTFTPIDNVAYSSTGGGSGNLVGTIRIGAATNCVWSYNGTTFTTLNTNDNDCGTITVTGSAIAPAEGKIPAIQFASLPAGSYEVTVNAQFQTLNTNFCAYRIWDGSTHSGWTVTEEVAWTDNMMTGVFTYGSTQTNKTFYIQTRRDGGTGGCDVANDLPTSYHGVEITVKSLGSGSGGSASAAGSDRQMQFNSGGSFGAATNLVYTSAGRMGIGNAAPTEMLDVTGTVRASESLQLGLVAGAAAPAVMNLDDLGNVDASSPSAGHVLTYSGGSWVSAAGGGGGGSDTFIGLTDVPAAFTGAAGRFVKVNPGESALEFSSQVFTSVSGASAPFGITLTGLDDVAVDSVNDGEVLMYSAGSGLWVPGVGGGGGGGGLWTAGTGDDIYYNSGTAQVGIGNNSPVEALDVTGTVRISEGIQLLAVAGAATPTQLSLDDLQGVNVTSPTAGHVLTYSGGNWISAAASGGSGSPGGSDRQVQFNSGGAFAGGSGLVYTATGMLAVGSSSMGGGISNFGVERTATDNASGFQDMAYAYLNVNPSANHPAGPYNTTGRLNTPFNSFAEINGTFTKNRVYGATSSVDNYGSGTVSTMGGFSTYSWSGAGTVTDNLGMDSWLGMGASAISTYMTGISGSVELSDSSSVTASIAALDVGVGIYDTSSAPTIYGVRVWMSDTSSTTPTNRYGVYLDTPVGTATNDWGIYQAGTQMNYLGGGLALGNDVSPAAIAASQNNYAPTGHATASVLRLTASGTYNITGLAGGVDGRILTLTNIGSNAITLVNESASSTAGNRFAIGSNITLAASQSVVLMYDLPSTRWRAIATYGSAGAASAAGSDREIQFNSGGSFGSSSAFIFNSAGQLALGNSAGANTRLSVGHFTDWNPYTWKRAGSFYAGSGGSSASYNASVGLEATAETQVTGAGASEAYGISADGQTANDAKSQTAVGVNGAVLIHNTDVGYSLYAADNNSSTGGTIYGLYINLDDPDATRWGIYQTTANNNRLNGNLGIGIDPSVALDVSGSIEYTGTITDVSDRRLKTDIVPLRNEGSMLDKVGMIDTYTFRMKDDMSRREYGVMAQELEKVFPELVHTANDEMGTKSVNYVGLIAPMIEATKELKAENDNLRAEIAALRAEREEITTALNDLATDVKGLKAHTGYGIDRAEMGLWMLLIAFASGSLVLLLGGIVRNRQQKAE